MMRSPISISVIACSLLLPAVTRAQSADSLDMLFDADALPSESAMEELLSPLSGGRLVWRSGWSRTAATVGGRHGFRLIQDGEILAVRLSGDHDPGERIVTGPFPRILDHVAVSVRWKPVPSADFIAGTFRRHFGLGLTAGSERFGAPWSDAPGAVRVGTGVRPWAASSEDLYLSGLATRLVAGGTTVSTWVSLRTLDASVDSAGTAASARWRQGGLHATSLERSGADGVAFREAGTALQWSHGAVTAGAIVIRNTFSHSFCASDCDSVDRYYRTMTAGSGWLRITTSTGGMVIEARPHPAGVDLVGAGFARIRRAGDLMLLVRRIGGHAGPVMAAPPSSRSGPGREERGMLVQWRLRMSRDVGIDVASDLAVFPDGAFSNRSHRLNQRLGLDVMTRAAALEIVLRRSVRTTARESAGAAGIRREVRHRVRIRARIPIGPSVRLSAFADASGPRRIGAAAAVGSAIDWRPSDAWRVAAGSTEFQARGDSAPIVAYEPDTPLAYPLRQLSGSGRRIWLLLERRGRQAAVTVSAGSGVRFRQDAAESNRGSANVSIALTRRW